MKQGKLRKIEGKWNVGTTLDNDIWSNFVEFIPEDDAKLKMVEEIFGYLDNFPLVFYGVKINPYTFIPVASLVTHGGRLKEFTRMAEESWEGCHGCDDNDKNFFINGFVTAMFRTSN